MKRTVLPLAAALALCLFAGPVSAQEASPAPPAESGGGSADFDYVANHNGLMFQLKQIYAGGAHHPTLFFGENLSWLHSPCGSAAYCTNGGGTDTDIELGPQIFPGHVFAAIAYGSFHGNGLSIQGLGYGLQKLPTGKLPFDWSANFFYWDAANGTYFCPVTNCFGAVVYPNSVSYRIYRWQAAGQYYFRPGKPWYVNFGVTGDTGDRKQALPIDFWHAGGFVGLGIKM